MTYIKATIDGQIVYIQQLYDGTWAVMNEEPSYPGINPIEVIIVIEGNTINVIGYNDATLTEFIRKLVFHESRNNLIAYLPLIMQEVIEFKQFMGVENWEIDRLHDDLQAIADDAYILTASAARIAEWEKDLKIKPVGTLAQRKSYIISYLRGSGKLTEARIKYIVSGFTGGDCLVEFHDSTIWLKLLIPPNGEYYRFADIERALLPKIPAHLDLDVKRYYGTWGDIKDNFSSWADVASQTDWQYIYNFYEV